MSLEDPFAFHYQSVWAARALDMRDPLPLWQRVAFLGFGKHNKHGRANFAQGELFAKLEKFGVTRADLSRAIATAKKRGYIDGASDARCLVMPPYAVTGGLSGNDKSLH
jgi:hypothetical protein